MQNDVIAKSKDVGSLSTRMADLRDENVVLKTEVSRLSMLLVDAHKSHEILGDVSSL